MLRTRKRKEGAMECEVNSLIRFSSQDHLLEEIDYYFWLIHCYPESFLT